MLISDIFKGKAKIFLARNAKTISKKVKFVFTNNMLINLVYKII